MFGPVLYVVGALAVGVQSTAVSAPPAAAAKVDPEAKQAALKLASILYSPPSQVALAERLVDTQLASTFRGDENFQALEQEFPGFTDAVLKEVKPALVRFTKAALPEYHDRVASLFASALSRADIEDMTAFYLTPTGKKLIAGIAQNITLEAMLAEASANPDRPTSYSAVAKDQQVAVQNVIKTMDERDKAAFLEFAKKPYAFQVALLGAAVRKLEQDFANEPAPEFEKEIETIIEGVVARFEVAKRR